VLWIPKCRTEKSRNRVAGGLSPSAPKPPSKRVRTRRFTESIPPFLVGVRKNIFIYVILAVALPIFFIILGWQTLKSIGTGFIFVSLCLLIFGTLTLFGNPVPDQLSKLSLPKYRPPSTEPHKETEIGGSAPKNRGKEPFFYIFGL